jgi:hypothetical protein
MDIKKEIQILEVEMSDGDTFYVGEIGENGKRTIHILEKGTGSKLLRIENVNEQQMKSIIQSVIQMIVLDT